MDATVTLRLDGLNCASCVRRAETALAGVPGVGKVAVNLATGRASVAGGAVGDMTKALAAAGYPPRATETVLTITGMTCAGCAARVEAALTLPGVERASVNPATGKATIHHLEEAVTPAALITAVRAAGYGAAPAMTTGGVDRTGQAALVAGLLTLPVFILEMGAHLWPPFHHWIGATLGHDLSRLIQLVLVTLVLIGPGWRFLTVGLRRLSQGAPDMNSLVALGAGAAYGASVAALVLPGFSAHVYFESAGVIVTLILVGRWLEARAKGQAGAAIAELIALRPETALVEGEERAVDMIRTGDQVTLRPGERVAVDGRVIEGRSLIDESMLTGEPVPVSRGPGDRVAAGTLNGTGTVVYEAEAVGADTALARIVAMVESAQASKLPIQSLIDQISARFVPAVLAIAVLTLLVWLALGAPLAQAIVAATSVLIIACPCAMGLATPVSILAATGRAARLGILFRRGEALQRLASVRRVAFDKTGTLTQGKPVVSETQFPGGDPTVLNRIAALEARSEHPLAAAILAAAGPPPPVEAFEAVPGRGVRGVVQGRNLIVGSARFLREEGIALPESTATIYAAEEGQLAAMISIADPTKPGSAEAVAALSALGVETAMISGDARPVAETVARQIGIDTVEAEVLPADKAATIARLGAETTAFVGDGINDAPALAASAAGLAMGQGSDVAIEAGEVVLVSGDPRAVASAIRIARATMANIRQNLVWAFGYNTLLIPVAAGVLYPAFGLLLTPMLAAGAMSLSSLFVVANALRLRRAG